MYSPVGKSRGSPTVLPILDGLSHGDGPAWASTEGGVVTGLVYYPEDKDAVRKVCHAAYHRLGAPMRHVVSGVVAGDTFETFML